MLPNTTLRRVTRDRHEDARDHARSLVDTETYKASCNERKKVEMLFAHLKRHMGLRRQRRVPARRHRPEPETPRQACLETAAARPEGRLNHAQPAKPPTKAKNRRSICQWRRINVRS